MISLPHDGRTSREVAHFNRVYAEEAKAADLTLPDSDKARYAGPSGDTVYSKEYYYHLLAPLRAKKVLEIACGNRFDACLSAHYGAEVYAYDASPMAIDMARQRAEVNGLSGRIHWQVCHDIESAFVGERFDVVMGFAVLHHLPLHGLGGMIYARLRAGGLAVFVEPVINSRLLARIRALIPYRPAEVTDDEQPLNDNIIAELAGPFSRMHRREFECISRIYPLFAKHHRVVHALHWIDSYLMKCAPLKRFASVNVLAFYRDA